MKLSSLKIISLAVAGLGLYLSNRLQEQQIDEAIDKKLTDLENFSPVVK